MNITIHPELRAFVDPLSANEYAALERSLLAEGCRDALVLWNDTLIDGHNRYEICRKHNIEFRTVQNTRFDSIEDVMLWMIDNHLGRRSVSDYQRGVLALRKKDIVSARATRNAPEDKNEVIPPVPKKEELAREARISAQTIGQIERIQRAATPQLMEAVRQGTISINAAANVASLPESVQIAAVAGGKKELQQMARQVREQKAATRAPRTPKNDEPAQEAAASRVDADSASISVSAAAPAPWDEVAILKARVAELTAENEQLKAQLAARS